MDFGLRDFTSKNTALIKYSQSVRVGTDWTENHLLAEDSERVWNRKGKIRKRDWERDGEYPWKDVMKCERKMNFGDETTKELVKLRGDPDPNLPEGSTDDAVETGKPFGCEQVRNV